jgi:cytochrome c-type biogenesis protein CcmH
MRLFLAMFVVLASMAQAIAVQPDEILKDPALEARARALSGELRCLVCQNQSIDDSDAPLARDLRILLREQIQQGKSDGEVMDFIVARYGEYVLLKPRFSGQTLVLWGLPFAALALAGLALFLRRKPVETGENPLSEAEKAALERLNG